MPEKPIVHLIPATIIEKEMRIGIYARVSSNSTEQLSSLIAQISALTRLTSTAPGWLLVDTYIDIATSKTGSSRKGFARLPPDCHSKSIDIILTKSISRFGRDTVDILDALRQFKARGVRIIFQQEDLDTANADDELTITLISSMAQAENESRSENIKWSKRTIDFMLSNEKYIGTVRLLNSGKYEFQYVSTDNNPAIITDEQFKLVQNEKLRRSNVVRGKNGNRRKDTKYSSKK